MPLFVDAYEAATAHLSMEEDGAYNRLLRLCWRSPKCSVPNDDDWIRKHLRSDAETYDRVVMPIISEFFIRKNGRVFQKRLSKEYRYVTEAVRKKKEGGRRGGKAKALKDKENTPSTVKAKPAEKPSIAIAPTPTPTPTPTKKEYTLKQESQFKEFWDVFAYKNGRAPALKSWMKIEGYDDALLAQILASAEREAAARPGIVARGLTPKMAQGWITDRRWEDEAPRSGVAQRSEWTAADWLKTYPPDKAFAANYVRRNFCADDIPKEIRGKYGF